MSVINKMLQDLDKRQQGHSLSNVTAQQVQYLGRPNSPRTWWLISLLALLLGGLAVYALQRSERQDTAIAADTPATESSHATQSSHATESNHQLESSPQTSAPIEAITTNTASTAPAANDVQATATQATAAQATATKVIDAKPIEAQVTEAQVTDVLVEDVQPKASGQMAVKEVKLSPSQLAQKQLALASDAEKQGQLPKAMDHYAKALKLDSSQHGARKQLAALYYGQHELSKAADVLSQGRLLYPQEFEFALLLARVQHAMGDTTAALASLKHIPDSHALARQKWLAQTDLAQQQGQFTLVEQAYRQLLQQEPQQAKWWMGLAYALDSQKQFAEASQAYRSALGYSGLSTQATAFIEQRLQQLGDSQ